MGGITSNLCLWIDAFEQFGGWLVIRILGNELAMNGEVEDFGLGLVDCYLQFVFAIVNGINNAQPSPQLVYNAFLLINWRYR